MLRRTCAVLRTQKFGILSFGSEVAGPPGSRDSITRDMLLRVGEIVCRLGSDNVPLQSHSRSQQKNSPHGRSSGRPRGGVAEAFGDAAARLLKDLIGYLGERLWTAIQSFM